MKHLVQRPQVGSFLRVLPCRFSIFRFPKTISWQNSLQILLQAFPVTLMELLKRNNFKDWLERQAEITESFNLCDKNMDSLVSKFKSNHTFLRDDQTMEYAELKKRINLRNIFYDDMHGENMESKGVPNYKVLAAYIILPNLRRVKKFLNKLEEKGPKGTALATLRRSERLLFSDDYCYLLRRKEYMALMISYSDRGEMEDLRRLWNLAKNDKKLLNVKGYSYAILAFLMIKDIEGAHEVLEKWENGIFHVEIRNLLNFRYHRKMVKEKAELMVDIMQLKDHTKGEEEKKKRAMKVRQNGWDPKKNLDLAAYVCVQYVEGRREIESAVNVLRLLGTEEPQDDNNDRLSRKMVEAMIGGGYYGEQE